MHTAVIGGGAAGFFLAINLKEKLPSMQVSIIEASSQVLSKVRISGGGRCNCTNTFEGINDLSAVYPRGHRLMKRLFNVFDNHDAMQWFERHGVPLVNQPDHCVFPASQNSQSIIDCFLRLAKIHGITIRTRQRILSMDELGRFDFVVIATGGSPKGNGLQWLAQDGHIIVSPVPSLFSLSVGDKFFHEMMGTVCENVIVRIPGMNYKASGALLITHWGVSGPAILKLSSYAARALHDMHYNTMLSINWCGAEESVVRSFLEKIVSTNRMKKIASTPYPGLTARLWAYLLSKSIETKADKRWDDLSKKEMNRLVNILINDTIAVKGRAPFRDEFVTCGGVSLKSINPSTLESRVQPGLYFTGEVLDIDGITGGFNFQAAWTTAYTVACSIEEKVLSL